MEQDLWDTERKKKLSSNSIFYNTSLKYESKILFFPLHKVVESISAAITWKNLKEANGEQNDTRWWSESKQRTNKH